jgi:hypothetical protein
MPGMHYYHGKGKLYRSMDEGWQEYIPGRGWVTSYHGEGQVMNHPDDFPEIAQHAAIELAMTLEDN